MVEKQGELTIVREQDAIALPAVGVLTVDEADREPDAELIFASAKSTKYGKKEKVTSIGEFINQFDEWLLRSH
ncbi:hypothetical protein [Agrobacterium sp. lyk4-40-TYG-31]|uniref:hypothetical protein n=1 Tax=Agrobacterium sp. lyk4-40-TYG-31 TaxID=3040276 RepID=UPI00254CBD1B|nr:hypothetical protein [Agrobacterium sp. lyk4-40-TYG-31]